MRLPLPVELLANGALKRTMLLPNSSMPIRPNNNPQNDLELLRKCSDDLYQWQVTFPILLLSILVRVPNIDAGYER